MTPLARGILSSAKSGLSKFVKYFMSKFDASYGVDVPDDATLDLTNDFSGGAFVYPNNRDQEQFVISKYSTAGNRSWFLSVQNTGKLIFGHSTDGTAVTFFVSTVIVPEDILSLVHFRLTGGTLYVGINGASEQSVARGACFSGTAPVEIGKVSGSVYSDDFDITQTMLFNSGSSLANFATIYNGGIPLLYSLLPSPITSTAVMAFELSSNDDTVTDLSTAGNDGAFVGGSFTDGFNATWQIEPSAPITFYRIHENLTAFPPSVVITNPTELTYVSSFSGVSQCFTLIHVSKSDIDGNKLFMDWDSTTVASANVIRDLALYDGHIEGDDALFVNNTQVALGTSIYSTIASAGGRVSQSTTVPSLAAFGDDITIIITGNDNWNNEVVTHIIYELSIRETSEALISTFDLLGTIAETGTDGNSSFGTIAQA